MKIPIALAVIASLASSMRAAVPAQAQSVSASVLEPAAVDAARRMRAYLHGLNSFEVRVDATMEEVLDDNLKVQLTNRVRYEYRAPDKLFAE